MNNRGWGMDSMIGIMIAFAIVLIILVILTYVIKPI